MEGFEILIPILGILVGGTAVIVPIAGLTARFALKPLVESFARMREAERGGERMAVMEQRLALLEEQLHAMERDQARLLAETEFRSQLGESV